MNPLIVVAGVTLSAKVIGYVCGELSEKEEIERKKLEADGAKYKEEIDKLKKKRKKLSEEGLQEALTIQRQYIFKIDESIKERIQEYGELKEELQNNIKSIRSVLKENLITPIRKSSLEKLVRQLYEAKEKCYAYIIYLKKLQRNLKYQSESEEITEKINGYSSRLPAEFPYRGKVFRNTFCKEQLLCGNFSVNISQIDVRYTVIDDELLGEWDDGNTIPVFVDSYNRDTKSYCLSIEKGMFYTSCLENTKVGMNCTVSKVLERGVVLKYKENLQMYLPYNYLDNPNKKPPVRTDERVFICDWSYGLGNYDGCTYDEQGNVRYAIKVAENPRFAVESVGLEYLPLMFNEGAWAPFGEFLLKNNLSDETAEWKIGLINENEISLEAGRKVKLQLGSSCIIIASICEIEMQGNNVLIAKYEDAFLPDKDDREKCLFEADEIFVAVDCGIMPFSNQFVDLMGRKVRPDDLSRFWIDCFAELRKQKEIKNSQFGMRYFHQWGDITEKLISFLKKGERFSLEVERADIREEKGSVKIEITDKVWNAFERNLEHYLNKQSLVSGTLTLSYWIMDKGGNKLKAEVNNEGNEITVKQAYSCDKNIVLRIRNQYVQDEMELTVGKLDYKDGITKIQIRNSEALKAEIGALRKKSLEKRVHKLAFVIEDADKYLYDVKLSKGELEIIGKYSIQHIEKRIDIFTKEIPGAEIKQISAYNSFKVGQMQNRNLQSFLLDGRNVVPSSEKNSGYKLSCKRSMNAGQKDAMKRAFYEDNLFMIQGPPGTGKTTVIKLLVKEYLKSDPGVRILIASQANVAVDNVLKGLIYDKDGKKYNDYMVRCGSGQKIDPELNCISLETLYDSYRKGLEGRREIDEEIYEKWLEFIQPSKGLNADIGELLIRRKRIVGATCVGIARKNIGLDRETFDIVIIDEAGKALPTELLIPMIKAKKVILIGDHKQLPPVINPALYDPEKIELENRNFVLDQLFEVSYFEKMYNAVPSSNKAMLNIQYRMPEVIGNMVSQLFYEGKLYNGEGTEVKAPIFHNKNLVFYDMRNIVDYREVQENTSVVNLYEAVFLCQVLKKLHKKNSEVRIAIITPYKGQKRLLQKTMLQEKIDMKKIACDTVDSFQGDEAEVVIFCMTRSQKPTRYFNDNRRLNVAFSRAKNELILIGSSGYFKKFRKSKSVMPEIGEYLKTYAEIIVKKQKVKLTKKEEITQNMILMLSDIVIDSNVCQEHIDEGKRDRYIKEFYEYNNKIITPIEVKRKNGKYYLVHGIDIYSACNLMEQEECYCYAGKEQS